MIDILSTILKTGELANMTSCKVSADSVGFIAILRRYENVVRIDFLGKVYIVDTFSDDKREFVSIGDVTKIITAELKK